MSLRNFNENSGFSDGSDADEEQAFSSKRKPENKNGGNKSTQLSQDRENRNAQAQQPTQLKGGGSGNGSGSGSGTEPPEELLKGLANIGEQGEVAEGEIELKTTKKARRTFDERILTNRDGLLRIYTEFPSACKFRGVGHEAQDIKNMLNKYKEWAFQLYPGLAFPDILSRCETLGSKAVVRSYAENLRDRERSRYLNEVLGVDLAHIRVPQRVEVETGIYGGGYGAGEEAIDVTSPEASSRRNSPSKGRGGVIESSSDSDNGGDNNLVEEGGVGTGAATTGAASSSSDLYMEIDWADLEEMERQANEIYAASSASTATSAGLVEAEAAAEADVASNKERSASDINNNNEDDGDEEEEEELQLEDSDDEVLAPVSALADGGVTEDGWIDGDTEAEISTQVQ